MSTLEAIKTLPWGEQLFVEIPLHKKPVNKFYARHGKTSEGREYIEFSKFGPRPNADGEIYSQKLRLFTPAQWVQLKHYVEGELATSIGWDLLAATREYQKQNQATDKSART